MFIIWLCLLCSTRISRWLWLNTRGRWTTWPPLWNRSSKKLHQTSARGAFSWTPYYTDSILSDRTGLCLVYPSCHWIPGPVQTTVHLLTCTNLKTNSHEDHTHTPPVLILEWACSISVTRCRGTETMVTFLHVVNLFKISVVCVQLCPAKWVWVYLRSDLWILWQTYSFWPWNTLFF